MEARTHRRCKSVRTFEGYVNAAYKSGNYSKLASMYVPGATLRVSDHTGPTWVFHGVAQIAGFYKSTRTPGQGFTIDNMTLLSPNIVYVYEHFGRPGQKSPSRCAHTYVLDKGKIAREEFVEYYPGKGM